MNNKYRFYSKEDLPTTYQKNKMWSNVKHSIDQRGKNNFYFDIRNFSMGFGFAIVILFAVIGIKSILTSEFQSNKPEIVKLNEAYFNAIKYIEKNSSLKTASLNTNINLDEILSERNEQLKIIDQAINDFKQYNSGENYSHLEQTKLNDLYKMKLEIISKLIQLQEQKL